VVVASGSAVDRRLPRLDLLCILLLSPALARAGSLPALARHSMVVSQDALASRAGAQILARGGNAIDAAVATAFALAVVHPTAGNLGGGGFLLYRPAQGEPVFYDFREKAPAAATPTMFMRGGRYDHALHHDRYLSIGVPGTVAGLAAAWHDHGRLPWKTLLAPAIALARDGFPVSFGLAESLARVLPEMRLFPASVAQFSRNGVPYEAGDVLRQPDLARTLERLSERGAREFYEGETATLIEKEMRAHGGLITREDLAAYTAERRAPLRGTYRGYDVLAAPPPSSGGTVLLESLNVLEGYDLAGMGFSSAAYVHHLAEALRRAFCDRARYLGDPGFVRDMPVDRLISKAYAEELRRTIRPDRASVSSPDSFEWPAEGHDTTHFSVIDQDRDVVSLTYTLEQGYGSKVVVPGAGFLLNNEMGDFNAGPGLTDATGLIGTAPNLAAPGKRMLSNMAPTIVTKDGLPYLVTGAAGGRKIPGTVLQVLLNVVDFGMNAQEAIDAPRVNHQWLPDEIELEPFALSADTIAALRARGHAVRELPQGDWSRAQALLYDRARGLIEGGVDRRAPDGAAEGR
jgi:gamma-glutamyltranspeptidase/glutathione hydrolase